MIKPAAGYRPLAYSSPKAVQTTGTVAAQRRPKCSRIDIPDQRLTREFPTHPNREIFGGLQGIRMSDQGNYPPYQGIRDFGPILDYFGTLKMPFSPILAGNRLFSRCD